MRDALDAAHRNEVPPPSCVALPSGLNRSSLRDLPLSIRTFNCLQKADLFRGDDELTIGDLLDLRNFGFRSLKNLLFSVARHLNERLERGTVESPNLDSLHISEPPNGSVSVPLRTTRYKHAIDTLLPPLLRASADFLGASILGDVLTPAVLELSETINPEQTVTNVSIDSLVDQSSGLPSIIVRRAKYVSAQMTPTELTIADLRILKTPPVSLRRVAELTSISAERVRQIQMGLESQLTSGLGEELRSIAAMLTLQLGSIVREKDVIDRIDRLLLQDLAFPARIARQIIRRALRYKIIDGVCVDDEASQIAQHIRSSVECMADDVGIVDRERIVPILPDNEWRRRADLIFECCGLYSFFGFISIRDSQRARIKAALLSIGRVATRDEVAELCGLTGMRVGSILSSLPEILRAGKTHWGLAEWIDDEYDGVVEEIVKRIEEDGGVTTTKRLFLEIPRKFRVSESSIYSHLHTAKFVVRDGCVSLRSHAALALRGLDDVIHGRLPNGAPYWSFVAQVQHFEGYSLTGVPPEFVRYGGCPTDGRASIRLTTPGGCPELTLSWRLGSTTGASIGHVAAPLNKMGAHPGDRIRLAIGEDRTAELSTDASTQDLDGDAGHSALDRMKARRRVL